MDDESRILKVDFAKGKLIEAVPMTTEDPIVSEIQKETTGKTENLAFYRKAIVLVGSFRIFMEQTQGRIMGETYRDATVRFQNLSIQELVDLLNVDESMWKKNPQHYRAIADLIQSKIPNEAGDAIRSELHIPDDSS